MRRAGAHDRPAALPIFPVLFLETGYHFPETLAYRDKIASEWNLNLVNLEAKQSVADQEAQFGILNQTAPDQCCKLRKVGPLFAGLANYDIWFTALRREQSPTRANLQEIEPFKLPARQDAAKDQPPGRLDRQRSLGLSQPPRHRSAAALRSGLHQHRLPAVHRSARQRRRSPLRPLAGQGQAGVRHSHSGRTKIPMEIALGFIISVFIALTGVGAGSLTTPLLILLAGTSGEGMRRHGADLRHRGEGHYGTQLYGTQASQLARVWLLDRSRIAGRDRRRLPDEESFLPTWSRAAWGSPSRASRC